MSMPDEAEFQGASHRIVFHMSNGETTEQHVDLLAGNHFVEHTPEAAKITDLNVLGGLLRKDIVRRLGDVNGVFTYTLFGAGPGSTHFVPVRHVLWVEIERAAD